MQRRNILAHRGMWTKNEEKNSMVALTEALTAGFGVETDFRDLDGMVVISHDPPGTGQITAETFFKLYTGLCASGRLALNIKADGLQTLLAELFSKTEMVLENCFTFDMSVPDTLGYFQNGLPAYTRVSEYETEAILLDRASGVWVDSFTGGYPQIAKAHQLMLEGHRVCIVSPELHKREHRAFWDEIVAVGMHQNPLFELCTDFPQEAFDLMGTE